MHVWFLYVLKQKYQNDSFKTNQSSITESYCMVWVFKFLSALNDALKKYDICVKNLSAHHISYIPIVNILNTKKLPTVEI